MDQQPDKPKRGTKNATTAMVKRWIKLESYLLRFHGSGLNLKKFSEETGISDKKLRRDLAKLAALGQVIEEKQFYSKLGILLHFWFYAKGTKPLFTENYLKSLQIRYNANDEMHPDDQALDDRLRPEDL